MKMNNDMDEQMKQFEKQWDIEEPILGHQQRFMDRLAKPKKKFPLYTVLSIAASVLLLVGLFFTYDFPKEKPTAKMSPEAKETQVYFNSIIKKELAALEKEDDPESKKIIADALKEMEILDNDYKKLISEFSDKGENKQIIHAMITNLQTRIAFLERVSTQIENIKQIKANHHEKSNL